MDEKKEQDQGERKKLGMEQEAQKEQQEEKVRKTKEENKTGVREVHFQAKSKEENQEKEDNIKTKRVLMLYTKLLNGQWISKEEEAERYGVSQKSIQRDLRDIQDFLENDASREGYLYKVTYDRKRKKYGIKQISQTMLTNSEIFALCKILLDSRALTKGEMDELLDKLIRCCVSEENQKLVSDMVKNEKFHYIQPRHGVVFKNKMWKLSQAIQGHRYVVMDYQKVKKQSKGEIIQRKVKPLAVMFSEYYFYLLAYIADEEVRKEHNLPEGEFYPTIYRIDRIKSMKILDEHFSIPYANRFEEGEFRKRVQFMYGGKLRRVKFWYKGINIEAVLDRLPTAEVLEEKDGVYLVTAEVFGNGIDMWLRSQGDAVEVVE